MNILVIDDDEYITEALSRTLKRNNITCEVANNSKHVTELLDKFEPHVITLDINMPDTSGFDIIKLVRQHPKMSSTKILIVSGMTDYVLEDAVALGADDYIGKPFKPEHLLNKLQSLTDHMH